MFKTWGQYIVAALLLAGGFVLLLTAHPALALILNATGLMLFILHSWRYRPLVADKAVNRNTLFPTATRR